MRTLAGFAIVTTTLMAATSAQAQVQGTGFYVGAGAGINLLQDNNLNIDNYDVGPAGNIYGGYDWGSLRADLEVSIRENSHDGNNHQTTLGVMVNGYYDFEFGSPFVPYIGGGIGLGIISADFRGSNDEFFQDTQTAFAYAGIAGVSYNFSPALAAALEYRYLGTTGPTFKDKGERISSDSNNNHSFLVGVRYTFVPPPPAPAVVEQVTQARSYLVFFDFDSSRLTPEARQIVASAATDALQGVTTQINVTGHTDRSGSERYNQALSVRRGEAVRRELVADGVADSLITVRGVGEADPLVPTADGVREPQNRRVEIVLN